MKSAKLVFVLLMLCLPACDAAGASEPTPTAEPPAPTVAPSATSTLAPPTVVPSTPLPTLPPTSPPTVLPTATSLAITAAAAEEPTRIEFASGEVSAEIETTIAERETDYYVLEAQAGQIMSVEITSANNDVWLSVVGEDGTPLKRYQNGPPAWTSQLPATQEYFIHAVAVGSDTSYTLRVAVEPVETSTAERVEFAPGATSAIRSGTLSGGGTKQYVLGAEAGQVLEVRATGYQAPVNVTIYSPGGETWTGEPLGSEVYLYTTLIALPATGDYLTTLWVPAGAGATPYDVTFTINVNPTPAPSEPPERVEFGPGDIWAQRRGLLSSGPGLQRYLLTASVDQTMTIEVTSDDVPLNVTLESPSGSRWTSEATPVVEGYRTFQMVSLPETGAYLVALTKPDHTPSTDYEILFTIQ